MPNNFATQLILSVSHEPQNKTAFFRGRAAGAVPEEASPFLTARGLDLAMANYEIEPARLLARVPRVPSRQLVRAVFRQRRGVSASATPESSA
jgi:hypothetical protein